jgi:HAD superfamily, subfamily IIIB (Acid phosphatase)
MSARANEGESPVARWLVEAVTVVVALVGGAVTVPAQADGPPSQERWLADTRSAMDGSRAYLADRVDRGGRRLAVNLDIDNTALATYYAPGTAVPAVLRFARYARSRGVVLLFNTGRERGRLAGITRTLRRAGYDVREVCGRRAGERLVHGKQRCRTHFADEGWTVVANVGNRDTDFVGGSAGRAFRLPSYGGRLG